MASVNIGRQNTSAGVVPVTIGTVDRGQGTYLLGKPGAGKSTLTHHHAPVYMRSHRQSKYVSWRFGIESRITIETM